MPSQTGLDLSYRVRHNVKTPTAGAFHRLKALATAAASDGGQHPGHEPDIRW